LCQKQIGEKNILNVDKFVKNLRKNISG